MYDFYGRLSFNYNFSQGFLMTNAMNTNKTTVYFHTIEDWTDSDIVNKKDKL